MMEQLFNFDLKKIINIPKMRFLKERKILNYFMIMDFQIKDENWKFTDLNSIVSKNFKNITNNFEFKMKRNRFY